MNKRRITITEGPGRAAELRRAAMSFARALGAMAMVTLVVLGGRKGWDWLHHGREFGIQTITQSGLRRANIDELLHRARISPGQNIFSVNMADAATAMEQNDWVAHARVSRSLPSTVIVEIEERRPVAIASVNGLAVIDGEGRRIKALASGDGLDLPIVSGLAPEDFGNAVHPASVGVVTALRLLTSYQADRMGKKAPISELHVFTAGGETNYTAFCGDDPSVEVVFGAFGTNPAQELGLVLRRLERVWSEVEHEGRRARTIDLGNRERAEWIPARLEPIARADGP